MLEGICPKCGTRRVGWALRHPRYQSCPKCGSGLRITEDGREISEGYSPFTAERYSVELPEDIPAVKDKEKEKEKESS